MEKKRHKTFVKFIADKPPFKEGDIGFLIKTHRSYRETLDNNMGRMEYRGGKVQSLNGHFEVSAWETIDYVRIETTPALEILYGKYHKREVKAD